MYQDTVTIGVTKSGVKVFVEVPTADFTAMYYDTTITLIEIADRLGVGIQGVVSASKRLGLRSRYFHQRYAPEYTRINEAQLRELIEVRRLSFQKAADIIGVHRHHVARAVTEYGIKTKSSKRADCVPCVECGRCRLFKDCRTIVNTLYVLPCEAILPGEPAATDVERDSAPSIGYCVVPYCGMR